jgi:hypothetical protein
VRRFVVRDKARESTAVAEVGQGNEAIKLRSHELVNGVGLKNAVSGAGKLAGKWESAKGVEQKMLTLSKLAAEGLRKVRRR